MITENQLYHIGSFCKTHGISGEINLRLSVDVDIASLSCIVVDVDGIWVPFFFGSIRPRGVESYLVMIDGIDSENDASMLVNKSVYALCSEVNIEEIYDDGFYAEDLIGYKVETDDGLFSGIISDIDDSTENVLFIIMGNNGKNVLIPVADEFISNIDVENRIIKLLVPDGLIDL